MAVFGPSACHLPTSGHQTLNSTTGIICYDFTMIASGKYRPIACDFVTDFGEIWYNDAY